MVARRGAGAPRARVARRRPSSAARRKISTPPSPRCACWWSPNRSNRRTTVRANDRALGAKSPRSSATPGRGESAPLKSGRFAIAPVSTGTIPGRRLVHDRRRWRICLRLIERGRSGAHGRAVAPRNRKPSSDAGVGRGGTPPPAGRDGGDADVPQRIRWAATGMPAGSPGARGKSTQRYEERAAADARRRRSSKSRCATRTTSQRAAPGGKPSAGARRDAAACQRRHRCAPAAFTACASRDNTVVREQHTGLEDPTSRRTFEGAAGCQLRTRPVDAAGTQAGPVRPRARARSARSLSRDDGGAPSAGTARGRSRAAASAATRSRRIRRRIRDEGSATRTPPRRRSACLGCTSRDRTIPAASAFDAAPPSDSNVYHARVGGAARGPVPTHYAGVRSGGCSAFDYFYGKYRETGDQKNWGQFEWRGELMYVYSVLPHRVVQARVSDGACVERRNWHGMYVRLPVDVVAAGRERRRQGRAQGARQRRGGSGGGRVAGRRPRGGAVSSRAVSRPSPLRSRRRTPRSRTRSPRSRRSRF